MLKLSETKFYDTSHQTLYTYLPKSGNGDEDEWECQKVTVDKPEQPETGGLVIYGTAADALWAWVTLEHLRAGVE